MQKLFRLLPVLVVVSIIVAWSFPLLALGVRFDLWGVLVALPMMAGAALTAAIIMGLAGVCLLSAIRRQEQAAVHRAILVVLVLVVPVATVFHFGLKASQSPVIYDVSTDWGQPPAIAAISNVRPDSANPLQGAADVKALQLEHYPDVQGLVLAQSAASILQKAVFVATELGWRVEAVNEQAGILEATDRTFWFGFVDDITVRIHASPEGGSRVDVRSVSRVGKSDLGKNADRIRVFLAAIKS